MALHRSVCPVTLCKVMQQCWSILLTAGSVAILAESECAEYTLVSAMAGYR